MCDMESERRKIDAIILETIEPVLFSGQWNQAMLTEFAVASLSDLYAGCYSAASLRARCESLVALAFQTRKGRESA
ncbi:hypothetical protein [Rhodoblastus sp.]|uniref:hypothetical protein n=1 Tax=Rhodoblastus sp. TaxID=1962975 RepID=UPI0025FF01BC|nr:hypothetical protein [Rhodoblastus sp.]